MTTELDSRWAVTAHRLGLDEATSVRLFNEIVKRHSERHRHYHGLGHLKALFDVLEPFWSAIRKPARVELAIWFHDIVYNPMRSDNEARSADLFSARLSACDIDSGLVERVDRLIRATANHQAIARDQDDALFLDADFSILGAPAEVYDWYVDAVRKEYRLVPRPIFNAGRAKFLRHALSRARIFHTNEFEGKFGVLARENMARELTRIE